MAAIPGSVRVTGFIAPTDDTDTYASHDSVWGRGGLREVGDAAARNAITTDRRRVGMQVYQGDVGVYYRLISNVNTGTDADWAPISVGGSAAVVALPDATATTADAVLVDKYGTVRWDACIYNATTGARENWTIDAHHDGTATADATAATFSYYGVGPDHGHTIEVDVNGAGVAQTLRLRITANGAGWSAALARRFYASAGAS